MIADLPMELAELDVNELFEIRKFNVKAGQEEFPVLVLDSPDKWQIAKEIKAAHLLQFSEDESIEFELTGVSLADWERVEEEFVVPEERENLTPEGKSEIELAQKRAIMAKKVRFFEISTGTEIPGKTIEEKDAFLSERCVGHIEGLYNFITTELANLMDGRLISEYLQATLEHSAAQKVIKFSGFESWKKASETRVSFAMCRPFQNYVIEIPLRGISENKKREIEAETMSPKPPMLPARKKDGKGFDVSRLEPNFNDPSWRAASKAVQQKKTSLLFTECLTFEIPGSNAKEKYDWIALHLVGDVIRIKNFIENNILSYESTVNFFGASSYLRSY